MAQSFTDFELILVDDGSKDNCGKICDEYKEKDNRIRVIHKENGGLASARNEGLTIAKGEYVLFCDSDDFVTPNWCSHLKLYADQNNDFLVFGNFCKYYKTGKLEETMHYEGGYSIADFFLKNLPGFAWNKAFRLDLIKENDISFPKDVIIEDLPFVLEYLKYVKGIYACEYADYLYYQDDRETLSRKYYDQGFEKWREKYNISLKAIDSLLSNNDIVQAKKIVSNTYLYPFLDSLDNTFDARNKKGFIWKMKYNQSVISTKEFNDCLALADTSKEDSRYIWLLKRHNWVFAYFLKEAAKFRNRKRG